MGRVPASEAVIRPPSERTTWRAASGRRSARALGEARRVADHRGLDVGVRDRGERSLVLAELRQHVRRGGNGEAAHRVAGDRGGVLLERRPRVAVQERHGQRLDAAPLQILDGGANLVGVDGLRDLTARGRTTTHLTNVPDVDERLRLVPDDPAGDGAGGPRAGDLEDVPETLRHQEADARALALEHRVRRDRRAVQHGPDRTGIDSGAFDRLEDPAHDALGRVARRRHLGQHRWAAVEGHEQDVGERSADVDADEVGHAAASGSGGTTSAAVCSTCSRMSAVAAT